MENTEGDQVNLANYTVPNAEDASITGQERSFRHFDFISTKEDGSVLLGISCLNTRFNIGKVQYYDNIENITDPLKYTAEQFYDYSVCDGKFMNKDKCIVVADDCGIIKLYSILEVDGKIVFCLEMYYVEHDGSVLSLSLSDNKILSGGTDCVIKIWNSELKYSERTFLYAHARSVTCVKFIPDCCNTFVSSSLDSRVLLWDIRQEKCARVLIKSDRIGYTAVECFANNQNEILIGSENGSILLIDKRQPKVVLSEAEYFQRPVYRLSSHPELRYVAACADNNTVKVINYKDADGIETYCDSRHNDFVRGISWYVADKQNPLLLSAAWDTKVLEHKLPPL